MKKLLLFILFLLLIAGGGVGYIYFDESKSDKEKFESYVAEAKLKMIKPKWDKDNYLTHVTLSGDRKNLDLSGYKKLQYLGLQGFKSLEVLNLKDCDLRSLYLGNLKNLREIQLTRQPGEKIPFHHKAINYVKSFVSKAPSQKNKNLGIVSLFNLPKITKLNLSNHNLTALNISVLPKLAEVKVNGNKKLWKLHLSRFPSLETIDASDNNIISFQASLMPKLKKLKLSGNPKYTNAWFGYLPKIENMDLSNNNLTRLTLVGLPELKSLNASGNKKLAGLHLVGFPALTDLNLENSGVRSLKLVKTPSLKSLNLLGNMKLSMLNLEKAEKLSELKYHEDKCKLLELLLHKDNKVYPKIVKIEYDRDIHGRLLMAEAYDENDKYINFPGKPYAKIAFAYIDNKKERKMFQDYKEAQKTREEEDKSKFELTEVSYKIVRKKVYPSEVNESRKPVLGLLEIENPLDEEIKIDLKLSSDKFSEIYDREDLRLARNIKFKPKEVKTLQVYLPFSEKLWANDKDKFIQSRVIVTGRARKSRKKVRDHIEKANFMLKPMNMVTWDDFRNIAPFGSVDDPAVVSLANLVPKLNDVKNPQVPPTVDQAMKAYELLRALKLKYSYMTRRPSNEDTILTPSQTVSKGIAKCTDTTILYASVLQRLGYSVLITTFTWKGKNQVSHVMLLIDTGMSAGNWRYLHKDKQKIVTLGADSHAYIPMETTGFTTSQKGGGSQDFLSAWSKGADQFNRQHNKTQIMNPENTFRMGTVWKSGFKPVKVEVSSDTKGESVIKDISGVKSVVALLQKKYVKDYLESRKEYIELKTKMDKNKNYKSVYEMAQYYFKVRRYYDSKSYFENAVSLAPNDPKTYYYYTAILAYAAFSPDSSLSETRKDEAKIDFKKASSRFSQLLLSNKNLAVSDQFSMNYDLSKWYNLLGNKGKSKQHERLAEKAREKLDKRRVMVYAADLSQELKEKGISEKTIKLLQTRNIKPGTVKHLLSQGVTEKVLLMLVGSHFGDKMMRKVTLKKVSKEEHKKMLYKAAVDKYIQDDNKVVLHSSSEATIVTIKGYEKKPILIATGKGFSEEDALAIGTKGFSEEDALSIATKGFSEDDELSIATKGFSEDVFNIGQ